MSSKEEYGEILKDILEFSGGKRTLTVSQIAKYMGKSRPYLYDRYGVNIHGGWTVYKLATEMSKFAG